MFFVSSIRIQSIIVNLLNDLEINITQNDIFGCKFYSINVLWNDMDIYVFCGMMLNIRFGLFFSHQGTVRYSHVLF